MQRLDELLDRQIQSLQESIHTVKCLKHFEDQFSLLVFLLIDTRVKNFAVLLIYRLMPVRNR